jgi:hypothetical protein
MVEVRLTKRFGLFQWAHFLRRTQTTSRKFSFSFRELRARPLEGKAVQNVKGKALLTMKG